MRNSGAGSGWGGLIKRVAGQMSRMTSCDMDIHLHLPAAARLRKVWVRQLGVRPTAAPIL